MRSLQSANKDDTYYDARSVQLTLDRGGEDMATAAVCQMILKVSLPFSIIEDPLFRDATMKMRHVGNSFTFPTMIALCTVYLDNHY